MMGGWEFGMDLMVIMLFMKEMLQILLRKNKFVSCVFPFRNLFTPSSACKLFVEYPTFNKHTTSKTNH